MAKIHIFFLSSLLIWKKGAPFSEIWGVKNTHISEIGAGKKADFLHPLLVQKLSQSYVSAHLCRQSKQQEKPEVRRDKRSTSKTHVFQHFGPPRRSLGATWKVTEGMIETPHNKRTRWKRCPKNERLRQVASPTRSTAMLIWIEHGRSQWTVLGFASFFFFSTRRQEVHSTANY